MGGLMAAAALATAWRVRRMGAVLGCTSSTKVAAGVVSRSIARRCSTHLLVLVLLPLTRTMLQPQQQTVACSTTTITTSSSWLHRLCLAALASPQPVLVVLHRGLGWQVKAAVVVVVVLSRQRQQQRVLQQQGHCRRVRAAMAAGVRRVAGTASVDAGLVRLPLCSNSSSSTA